MIRQGVSIVVVLAAVAFCFCGQAAAAIYYGYGGVIGRVNNDGSYRLDASGLGPGFIGSGGDRPIHGVCGVAVDASHIYWGDQERGTIGRANLDGSDASFVFIGGASEPCGVAVDGTYVYWGNQGSASIGRARLDGSEVNQEFIKVPKLSESIGYFPRPCGVAVDGTHIFWANQVEGLIGRANIGGGEVTPDFIDTTDYGPCGVAVDATHLFWGSYSSEIGRANLDGTNPDPTFLAGLDRPCAVAADGGRLYWVEQGTIQGRRIGSANLDGTLVNRGITTEFPPSCGIAVNSLFFTPPPSPPLPPPPPAPPSLCKLEESRHLPRQGKVLIAVRGPSATEIEVLTRGLRSRVITRKAPSTANRNPRRWWVAIWPGDKGRAAKRIRERLAQNGRVTLNLRVRCTSAYGELPTTTSRSLALVAARQASEKPAPK